MLNYITINGATMKRFDILCALASLLSEQFLFLSDSLFYRAHTCFLRVAFRRVVVSDL